MNSKKIVIDTQGQVIPSSGSIRVSSRDRKLAELLPPGTIVEIRDAKGREIISAQTALSQRKAKKGFKKYAQSIDWEGTFGSTYEELFGEPEPK